MGRAAPFATVALALTVFIEPAAVHAQIMGEEAELERLQNRAEEAIANGDADGAAMNMGKAALMAAQLAKQQKDVGRSQWYRGAEQLFRAQEQAYRAQALFVRAGGQPPASSGVCGSLSLAKQHLAKAVTLLVDADPGEGRLHNLHDIATDWVKTLDGMNADFQC
ncbi:hypothetical protein [Candidatus Nitrospira bockiana]